MTHKDTLSSALDKICAEKKVSSVEDLLGNKTPGTLPSVPLICSSCSLSLVTPVICVFLNCYLGF